SSPGHFRAYRRQIPAGDRTRATGNQACPRTGRRRGGREAIGMMNSEPRYPSLYQINTRVWLTELSHALGKRATLDDIPDVELDRLAEMGFDWVWFLS